MDNQDYYFTFGQNHATTRGVRMKDYWIRVQAPGYMEARTKFIENFTSRYMPAPDKWAFQYKADEFHPEFFYKGEYAYVQ